MASVSAMKWSIIRAWLWYSDFNWSRSEHDACPFLNVLPCFSNITQARHHHPWRRLFSSCDDVSAAAPRCHTVPEPHDDIVRPQCECETSVWPRAFLSVGIRESLDHSELTELTILWTTKGRSGVSFSAPAVEVAHWRYWPRSILLRDPPEPTKLRPGTSGRRSSVNQGHDGDQDISRTGWALQNSQSHPSWINPTMSQSPCKAGIGFGRTGANNRNTSICYLPCVSLSGWSSSSNGWAEFAFTSAVWIFQFLRHFKIWVARAICRQGAKRFRARFGKFKSSRSSNR